MKINSNISGFSIIEVMIAIFIFSMWMASIFMVISASLNVDKLNKDQIIASNLASEQIEIIRNIRDDNYANFRKRNYIPNSWKDYTKTLEIWKYYKIENDYTSPDYPFIIKINWNQSFTSNSKQDFKDNKFDNYKLYLDSDNKYNYDATWTWTIFHRYIFVDELKDWAWGTIEDTLKIKSKVVWYSKWYHEFEINTILANFNRY